MWKLRKFTLTLFSQKFLEIDEFSTNFYTVYHFHGSLFFFRGRVNFRYFHSVLCALRGKAQYEKVNNLLSLKKIVKSSI